LNIIIGSHACILLTEPPYVIR